MEEIKKIWVVNLILHSELEKEELKQTTPQINNKNYTQINDKIQTQI